MLEREGSRMLSSFLTWGNWVKKNPLRNNFVRKDDELVENEALRDKKLDGRVRSLTRKAQTGEVLMYFHPGGSQNHVYG